MQGVVDLELHAGDIAVRQRERPLHDQGILAIGIIARTLSERFEAERLIERLRPFVTRANLERARARAQIARIGRHAREQLARNPMAPPRGIDPHLENLHVPVDDPAAGIADQTEAISFSRSAGCGAGGGRSDRLRTISIVI